jgi:hypothetical protein
MCYETYFSASSLCYLVRVRTVQQKGHGRKRSFAAQWAASRLVQCSIAFLIMFVLWFCYFFFFGPRRIVGYWIRHEPLALGPSILMALAIALATTIFVYKRIG